MTADEHPSPSPPLIVRTRDFISNRLVGTVERVDQFFGDERLEDDNKGTRLTIKLGVTEDRLEGTTFNHRFSARVALPQLENRLQVIADNWVEGGEPDDASQIRNAFENSSPVTALRWVIKELKEFRLTTDVGLRWSGDPQALFRLRARESFVIKNWEFLLSETLFAYSSDGVGETTEMRWSHDLGSRWLFRSISKVTWRDHERGVSPEQALEVLADPQRNWAQAFRIRGYWPETPRTEKAVYSGEWVLRRNLHRDWLFVELRPGIEFSQEDEFKSNPFVTLVVECIFGEA